MAQPSEGTTVSRNVAAQRLGVGSTKKRGGGGAARAFASQEAKNKIGKADFTDIGRRYRALDPTAKAALTKPGKRGTMIHKVGGKSFDVGARAIARITTKEQLRQDARVHGARGETVTIVPTSSLVRSNFSAWSTMLQHRKLAASIMRRDNRTADANLSDAFAVWRGEVGIRNRDILVSKVPELSSLVLGLHPTPHFKECFHAMMVCPIKKQLPRMVAAMIHTGHADSADYFRHAHHNRHKFVTHRTQDSSSK